VSETRILRPADAFTGEVPSRPSVDAPQRPVATQEFREWWNALPSFDAKRIYFERDDAFRALVDSL
jgi:hypothetical protein